jgi:hypothetical protein
MVISDGQEGISKALTTNRATSYTDVRHKFDRFLLESYTGATAVMFLESAM